MVKRPPPVTPEGFLATQDLKERGWTARLIRDFLGQHDAERPNGLKMGRRKLPPVKLYTEDRVNEAERDEPFLVAQGRAMEARERAEKAGRTRRANRNRLLTELVDEWTPPVRAAALRTGAVNKAREPYARALAQELKRVATAAGKLTTPEERFVKRALAFRLDAALATVYPWFPVPKAEEAPARAQRPDDDWD
ncbi:hypothetical protein MF271_11875 [Deinococcus sp. KNUC1210]|uniref:hypothetical protein n=1 Tax=Deinococcus sp. KNUC1210 TaxID=2917691 RepID=UPI001EEF9218|nr:hypothetical protein [Deinococcus sp. KNUC1210]ULH14699.1 hypothetical protein MF271_11875 [Deinococcus sp. KNUC1210]